MRKTLPTLAGLFLAAAATAGVAQIKAYTLPEMVAEADDAVFGEIVNRRVFKVDHPVDGPDLFFTTVTVAGESLLHDRPVLVDITYHGGFISEEVGVYNSEAPSADDVELGNRVVMFYAWHDDMGGGVAGNGLMAAHGGLFRSVDGANHTAILGRGAGYAIDRNIKLTDLGSAVKKLKAAKGK